jgi:hypothetical protein
MEEKSTCWTTFQLTHRVTFRRIEDPSSAVASLKLFGFFTPTQQRVITMAALNRPTKASYEVHETFKVDTSGELKMYRD